MKRTLLALLLCSVLSFAAYAAFVSVDGNVRVNNDSTLPGGQYYLVMDSTDTFYVDTLYSDTVVVDERTKWLQMYMALTGFALADSANDSVVVISTIHGSYSGALPITLGTDTFTTTLDSTESFWNYISLDSTAIDEVYFRTIIKDSFILGAGTDSTRFQFDMDVGQVAR